MGAEDTYPYFVNEDFIHACFDYHYLINRCFPERGVLKLVGDRYRLSGDQRTVLYRGISSDSRSSLRGSLLVTAIAGKKLVIDGYNVLFTLLNYRLGKITFISTDGILRDAGSLHGKLRDEGTFGECAELMMDCLVETEPSGVMIYLDSPVSHSLKHAAMLKAALWARNIQGDCQVIKSADWALKQNTGGILATSDTIIIEKAMAPVIDLPHLILRRVYQANIHNLNMLLSTGKIKNTIDDG